MFHIKHQESRLHVSRKTSKERAASTFHVKHNAKSSFKALHETSLKSNSMFHVKHFQEITSKKEIPKPGRRSFTTNAIQKQ